ncbi:hypothetical protein R1flu_027125 [Riccia fluitans]|uniref:Uncharacterized protein n=1 Tax=Riccia fluitans TaxID=41844 RepID=A0ABD1XHZ3_9MARC
MSTDPGSTSKSKAGTSMSALVRRVFGAGPRFKKSCSNRVSAAAEEQHEEEGEEDYFSAKIKGTSSSSTSSEMESDGESEEILKKGFWRTKSRASRKQKMYYQTSWIGSSRPKLAISNLRIRTVQLVRLVRAMAFLKRLRNACRRLVHAAGTSKAVTSLTNLCYVIADLIPRAGDTEDDEKCPAGANSIIILRPILLQSLEKRDLAFSLRNRADIQALRETLNLQALIAGAQIRTQTEVS